MNNLNFDEVKQSQLPFVEMLINLGYRYISKEEVNNQRDNNTSKFILKQTAFDSLKKINNKNEQIFSDKDIYDAIEELENIPLEGLIDTSKKVFGMLMPKKGGKTIKVFKDGRFESVSFKYIDFENIENNDFSVTVEYDATGKDNIRVDIVVFINGIPFSMIENKKSSVDVSEALNQINRNQGIEYCPKAFIYPQLLIGANSKNLKYGTTGTPNKFFAVWKERELIEEEWKRREAFEKEYDLKVKEAILKKIDENIYQNILNDLNGYTYNHKQIIERRVTDQDRGVYGIFRKDRLLDLSKNFVLYDGGVKKVMRYQQYFAIKKIEERIKQTTITKSGEKREGGILWQTQGSGKSLTMVMFVKALIENPNIQNPRILIVTDRRDLDRQIKDTFENAGLKKDVVQAKSGEHLVSLIKDKDLNVITTLVFKFQSASNAKSRVVDLDKNIFVLIDEAHRSQKGEANLEMNKIIPNACYIAFTGTPLLKDDQSRKKFGQFIDRYSIDDALNDEIVLPLIYEGRYVNLRQDKREVDKQISRITNDLEPHQLRDLQNQVNKTLVDENPSRIEEIAYDIAQHYTKYYQGTGLKAQVVAPSKYAATLFQKYFMNNTDIQTALVISDENNISDYTDTHRKEVEEYLNGIKGNYQSLQSYEKEVIDSFKHHEDGIEILIVVDKLLTGFDAPRNTVLYLSKDLKDHNLLQAIARVNRLFDNDILPKTAGYIIDYSENANNLKTAMQLFGNYDAEDVKGTLIDVNEKVHELQDKYAKLHDIFNGIPEDDEEYLQHLSREDSRKEFYDSLNEFTKVFNECISLRDFVNDFDNIDVYKNELKKYINLRKTSALKYADDYDFKKYKQALINILDKNIKADEAELLTKQISITDKEAFEEALQDLGSDKSKAEAIASQTKKQISEKMSKDPEFYKKFSDKIDALLRQMRDNKLSDIEALKQAKEISNLVLGKEDNDTPYKVRNIKGADIFYRNLKSEFNSLDINDDDIIDLSIDILNVLKNESVVDWHINNEKKRIMKNKLDDYIYDIVKQQKAINITNEQTHRIIDKAMELAQNNYELI